MALSSIPLEIVLSFKLITSFGEGGITSSKVARFLLVLLETAKNGVTSNDAISAVQLKAKVLVTALLRISTLMTCSALTKFAVKDKG